MGTFGDGRRCPTLRPKGQNSRAGAPSPALISSRPPRLAPPAPHTPPLSSYYLRRLPWPRNRWQVAKGTRKCKGDPASNLELVNDQPRSSAACTAGSRGWDARVLRGSAKRLLLPRAPLVRRDSSPAASPRVSVRETRPHSDPQAPALLGRKPGSRNRLQDTGLRPLRPPGPSPTES